MTDRIKEIFRQWDKDGNGCISKNEMKAVILRIMPKGTAMSEADVESCMVEADKNGNGVVDYDEFVDWLQKPGSKISKTSRGTVAVFDLASVLLPLFEVYDRDSNGRITKEEFEECHCILQNALAMRPKAPSTGEKAFMGLDAGEAFTQIDVNSDHYITFKEFVEWQRKALEKSGLLSEDLEDLVPALARQLKRVFKMSDMAAKGDPNAVDDKVLNRIIDNLSSYARDLWNGCQAGRERDQESEASPSVVHYTNRWTEPPVGLNIQRLKGIHLKLVPCPMVNADKVDLEVLCVPKPAPEDEPRAKRTWLAKVVRKITDKSGHTVIEEPFNYEFEKLNWHMMDRDPKAAAQEFEEALAALPPELRVFCLLKTEANFGTKITWSGIQAALETAVDCGILTSDQHNEYVEHMTSMLVRALRVEGLHGNLPRQLQRTAEMQLASVVQAPRNVMATLSELGIFKVSSVWADFMADVDNPQSTDMHSSPAHAKAHPHPGSPGSRADAHRQQRGIGR